MKPLSLSQLLHLRLLRNYKGYVAYTTLSERYKNIHRQTLESLVNRGLVGKKVGVGRSDRYKLRISAY